MKRYRALGGTKCCRTGNQALSFSIANLCRFSGRLTLLRGTPVCFRQGLHLTLVCVCENRRRCLPCRLVSCICLDLYLYIRVRLLIIVTVSFLLCCLTVIPVCLRSCACASASATSVSYSVSVISRPKTPVVPPFSVHTRNNATYLVNPT